MNQNVNDREHLIKQIGPVWKVRVAVYFPGMKGKNKVKEGIKRWKIKEILN